MVPKSDKGSHHSTKFTKTLIMLYNFAKLIPFLFVLFIGQSIGTRLHKIVNNLILLISQEGQQFPSIEIITSIKSNLDAIVNLF